MSSLYLSRGASKIFLRQKPSLSRSKTKLITSIIRCQCLGFIALFAISSRRGHISLKSSIVLFKAWNAGHSCNTEIKSTGYLCYNIAKIMLNDAKSIIVTLFNLEQE